MKSKLYIPLFFLFSLAYGQDSISLFNCYSWADENHPLGLKTSEFEKINDLNLKVIKASNLPQVIMKGQATYQSDVTSIDIDFPGINFVSPAKDQYRANLEISQMLYDGGISASRKKIENSNLKINEQEVIVDLHKIKESINSVFFNYLLIDENISLLKIKKDEIEKKLISVNSAVENGMLLKSDKLKLEVELLKLEQKTDELILAKQSSLKVLSMLVGKELSDVSLFIPHIEGLMSNSINRPEELLFDYQKEKLNALTELKKAEKMPKIAGFGQLGYGRPGLNMLSSDFNPYYIVGLSLSWNIIDWKKNSNEISSIMVQSKLVDIQENVFEKAVSIQLTSKYSEIEKFEKAIERDKQIVDLQEEILTSSSSQLDNGVITTNEYLTILNNLTQSKLNLKSNEIQLVKSKIEYLTISGNLSKN